MTSGSTCRYPASTHATVAGSHARLGTLLTSILDRLLRCHGLVLGGIALVALGVFGGALFVHPLDPDNLVALSIGPKHSLADYFSGGAHSMFRPAYRPFAELTLWLQYHVLGLQPHSYFFVGILLWVACGWLVYGFVSLATGSRSFAALAALATLLDARGILAVLWILERQATLALLLGFSALLLVLVRGRPRLVLAAVVALLLAAALSKEYGLAFAIAVPLFAWLQARPWKPVALSSLGAVVLYVILRFAVAGGAAGRFCDDMGYFHSTRTVCYSNYASLSDFKQHLWNAAASLAGTFFPSLFDSFGTLVTPSARSLVVPAIVAAAALVAAVKVPRWTLPLLVLLVLNAALNFVLYRTRNQLIGYAALYAAAAIGLQWLLLQARPRLGRWATAVVLGAALLAVGWLGDQAVLRPRTVQSFQQTSAASDACAALHGYPTEIDASVVRRLKERYHLPRPSC
jgi:hypothetical protein